MRTTVVRPHIRVARERTHASAPVLGPALRPVLRCKVVWEPRAQ